MSAINTGEHGSGERETKRVEPVLTDSLGRVEERRFERRVNFPLPTDAALKGRSSTSRSDVC